MAATTRASFPSNLTNIYPEKSPPPAYGNSVGPNVQSLGRSFKAESWVWYGLVLSSILARMISRTLLFGSVKRLRYDDWIMGIFVAACYTVLVVVSNIVVTAQTNLIPPDYPLILFQKDLQRRKYGSQLVLVVEQMQMLIIWACKACLLILYLQVMQLTSVKARLALKILAVYVAVTFVVMEVLYFAVWCRPFHEYWAVPTKNAQCNAFINHRIVNAVFNISSDVAMLCIALTIFIPLKLKLRRKLILCSIFSLGVFVILAAVLNKYYSFAYRYRSNWVFWYLRESSTAILVANLPLCWTLLRRVFNLGSFSEGVPPTYHSSRTATGRSTHRMSHHGHHPGAHLHGSQVSKSNDSDRITLIDGVNEVAGLSSSENNDNNIPMEPIGRRDTGVDDVEKGRSVHIHPHHAMTGHSDRGNSPSIASADHGTHAASGTAVGPPVGIGGGRSATDRKTRVRISEA